MSEGAWDAGKCATSKMRRANEAATATWAKPDAQTADAQEKRHWPLAMLNPVRRSQSISVSSETEIQLFRQYPTATYNETAPPTS